MKSLFFLGAAVAILLVIIGLIATGRFLLKTKQGNENEIK